MVNYLSWELSGWVGRVSLKMVTIVNYCDSILASPMRVSRASFRKFVCGGGGGGGEDRVNIVKHSSRNTIG